MVQASPVSSCIRSSRFVAYKRGTKRGKERERERGKKKEEILSFRMFRLQRSTDGNRKGKNRSIELSELSYRMYFVSLGRLGFIS